VWWRVSLAGVSVAISLLAILLRFGVIGIQLVADLGVTPPKPKMVGDLSVGTLILAAIVIAGVTPLTLTLFRKQS
jgi:hypothetical protein